MLLGDKYMSSNLLDEAIADAKQIREAAEENAKKAVLEAVTPKIKEFIESANKMFDDIKITLDKNWKDFIELLDKSNVSRKECLLLPIKTVCKALKI